MNSAKVKNGIKNICRVTKVKMTKHSPEILLAFGIAAGLGAVAEGIHATIKAVKLVDKKKEETGKKKLTAKEVLQVTWKNYIPTISLAMSATAMLVASGCTQKTRNEALGAAYESAVKMLDEYQTNTAKTVGEEVLKEIVDKTAQDEVDSDPVDKVCPTEIIFTGHGDTLCRDSLTGRYFYSDPEFIRSSIVDFRQEMLDNEGVGMSFNDWLDALGIENCKVGDILGWSTEDNRRFDVTFSGAVSPKNEPILVLNYRVMPYQDYYI